MTKTILGLDLGTNSIGWALINQDFDNKKGEILGMGSRIIPMTQDIKDEFGKGNSISQTAERTRLRGVRRLIHRTLLRRERLHRVLNIIGFLPEHYANQIDFEKRFGKFKPESEPKISFDGNDVFLFEKSYQEMLVDFKIHQPQLVSNGKKIPHDWTIYYLRKKALSKKIEKEELAWILLNFNQKRGYYQLRGEEEEETPNKLVEFHSLKIVEVNADEPQKGKPEIWYSLVLENGWVYRRASKTPLFDWKDKIREFIVTTEINNDGTVKTDKEGTEKRSFRAPKPEDWTLQKKKTEFELSKSGNEVGAFIYESILQKPNQKIRGKLISTIERKFYKEELKTILKTQLFFHKELKDEKLYNACIEELYKNNEAHRSLLSNKGFEHLFINDILFYQRPLRSKKSQISNCPLEKRTYKKEGIEITEGIKVISKSNPIYQEFRLWQWISNLSLYCIEPTETNVTSTFLNSIEDYENLFEFLNNRKEIEQKHLLKYLLENQGFKGKLLTNELEKFRWNFVADKKYPCNETGSLLHTRLSKVKNISPDFLTKEIEHQLWHIIYSVTDKIEYEQALKTFARKNNLDVDSFFEHFKKIPPFESTYGAYSEKAIKKLLPLIRLGKYWNWEAIDSISKDRISKILSGEYDENIKNRVREKAVHLTSENNFQGLQEWLAKYIVYDRHSEGNDLGKWTSVSDLETYLKEFKQHSLRNPIVEQVITETLRVVKDIWIKHGKGTENFFDEIHVELGREMKNNSEDRKRLTNTITENENTNLRIKALLMEMMNDNDVENVRPYSPSQQEILKIYEDGALNSNIELDDEIVKISKKAEPTKSELQRYKLWLEQKYRSPYTGQVIPLNKLFTSEYEIEHVVPQSRFFDDSFSNKVICESAVNKRKDNQLGLQFIKNHSGEKVELGFGKVVQVFTEEQYLDFVKEHYSKNRSKHNKLLLEEIPEKMIERQLNDTRYISKFVSSILSNIVRSEKDDDGLNSKNILPGNGKITTELKRDWGLNDVWNDLILPRFERMNTITNSDLFTTYNDKYQKHLPTVPFEYSKGFQKKRIDHRHHAMDALVIACATRDHLNLMNNQSAKSELKRYDLQNKLRKKEPYFNQKENKQKEAFKDFIKPWGTFTEDSKNALEKIIISFKQNLRVINKATNSYESYKDEDGNLRIGKDGKPEKGLIKQKGLNWAIRKPLHKDTVSGQINLSRIKLPNGKILTATRKNLDTSFDLKTIENSITDTGIQKILKNYLLSKESPELAFSPEGLEEMNNEIEKYNNGKFHHPINKARIYELGSKFNVGQTGNRRDKFVEAAKGTNLFFAIYQDENKNRSYETIPLNEVIEHQKWRASLPKEEQEKIPLVPVNKLKGTFIFSLSPNDLVYVPSNDELERSASIDFSKLKKEQINRLYKMVSSSGSQCFFVKSEVATSVVNKMEYSSLNKMEKSIDNLMVKEICIKLKIDRLGNISKA
ncbi:type II CRISPR RNA-guided endonuclease Cas9 [Fluviicola taffensis]|uniref:CRISPR-associated endonuclease Cas9 n=1 Tax=Fluviicola taffensis (strain DSM 16823 / NCIMB 13979 / RW262) TaxID=755732 RepID=F2IKJ5_FLUTR|nr:type II CRISPR RNA-guided endonuclease Cas9 [Fluviicola taffensis]AEA45121.1 CRISPR-associated protein, Csn1 family [Fluviicola taffensis DSM 16823]